MLGHQELALDFVFDVRVVGWVESEGVRATAEDVVTVGETVGVVYGVWVFLWDDTLVKHRLVVLIG